MKAQNSNISWKWLAQMAWRDGRSALRRLILFMGSIVLGIAGLVAIQNFGLSLENTITGQSRELMGADYRLDTNTLPEKGLLDTLALMPGTIAREVNLASMVSFPNREGTRLVRVRGVDSDFPFYGNLQTNPTEAAMTYTQWGGALLDATLMKQFDLKAGDFVNLGKLSIPIAGALESAPGNSGATTAVAPIVWIPYALIQDTGLIQPGSRVGYNFYFKLNENQELNAIHDQWDAFVNRHNADIDLHTDTSARMGRRFENVGKFLKLVAFIALLLGCLGISSSVNIYMKEKRQFIAILKCLGASRKASFLIFLIQISGIGILGGILGSLLGLLMQQIFPIVIQDFLPVSVHWDVHWAPVILGLLLGLVMSVLFGVLPLLNTLLISPLSALRVGEVPTVQSKRFISALVVLGALLLWVVGAGLLNDGLGALFFILGTAVTIVILGLISGGFIRLIRFFFPKSWSFEWRQGLLNLFRPNNQTLVLVLTIGFATMLISVLYFTQDLLLSQARLEDQGNAANLFVLDIQTNQRHELNAEVSGLGLQVLEQIPIVTMRLEAIKDKTVQELRNDSIRTVNTWILNHEFRVTYRDSLIASEKLSAGEWIREYSGKGPIPISLSDNVANDAGVGVGDHLIFNVQGVPMDVYVANIREVDWGRMQLNFSVLFPTGVLEQAPQFHVLTTQVANAEISARLQQQLIKSFPNVTILDLRQLLELALGVLEKITWVIRFMAILSMLTGFIVLLGAVRNSKYQRIRENVLLRTLGANSHQIRKINALEYLFLGGLGSIMGVFLALIATQILARAVFNTTLYPSWVPFGVIVPLVCLFVLFIGMINSRSVLKSPPLEVLRKEVI
ncbi:MAG: hypothetical protein RLZZ241_821 [Bacteroidota bacterium]|jgi:putative ABC transport system permease protein